MVGEGDDDRNSEVYTDVARRWCSGLLLTPKARPECVAGFLFSRFLPSFNDVATLPQFKMWCDAFSSVNLVT
jgi:hypothetical protein